MATIDLNCDLGESFGAYTIGADEEVMASITSANIACGYHGGDPGGDAANGAAGSRGRRRGRRAPGFPDLVGSAAARCA